MKPCTILDVPQIYEIIRETLGDSDYLHMKIRNDVVGTLNKYFIEENKLIAFDFIENGKYIVHIYSVSRDSRGKTLRDFAVRACRYMVDNMKAKSFLNFVDDNRLDLKIFMRMVGAKKICKIPGTNQILYVSAEGMGIRED